MKLDISYDMMKMGCSFSIVVDEPVSLDNVKEKIRDFFAQIFKPNTSSTMILKDLNGEVISTDQELQQKIQQSTNFKVIFC
jgi:hypothetical protein